MDQPQILTGFDAVAKDAQTPDETSIVVGGFSIQLGKYVLLRIDWEPQAARWETSVVEADPDRVVYIGDERQWAKQTAKRVRRHRETTSGWRMEPLCAIHSACGHPAMHTIGGDIQFAKAYSHGAARAYGIYDPLTSVVSVRGTRLSGRALFQLETRGLLVDVSSWSLDDGCLATRRQRLSPAS